MKKYAQTVELGSTPPAPTHQSAKLVIQESIKPEKEKQHVSHACQENTGEQTQQTASTVTIVNLARHQLNLVARSRAKNLLRAPLFSVVERRQ